MGSFDELSARLRGPVLRAGHPEWDARRTVWNGMIDRQPAAIACCLGTADVQQCVRFAAEEGVPLTIKGGGHNVAGLAVADGALMLDMSAMRGVWVDPASRSAKAQAGCLLGDVDRETQVHGLAAVLGFVSNTGIAGLTLGGGFGYLSRRYGWTVDNLNAIDLVTAEGELVRASAEENEELFWALRGGGGNFGVAVGFDYEVHPVGPEIVGGAIAWPFEQAAEVLVGLRQHHEKASRDLSIILGVRRAPPAPWIAPEAHGELILAAFVCHSGPIDVAEKETAPIKAMGSPVGDVIIRRPYAAQQALIDATQPKGRRYYWKSHYLESLTAEAADQLVAQASKISSPHSGILTFPFDGALNERPEDDGCVGNRDAGLVVNIAGAWDDPASDATELAWVRESFDAFAPLSTGGAYVNFMAEDEGDERTRQAYRTNYERLVSVKRRWDPTNLFSANKNIAP